MTEGCRPRAMAAILCLIGSVLAAAAGETDRLYAEAAEGYRSGDLVSALEAAAAGLASDPGAPGLWVLHGWILLRLDRVDEADASFAETLRLTPGNAEAATGRGYCALRGERAAAALEWFQRALAQEPGDDDALRGEMLALERVGRQEEALRRLESLRRIHPEDAALIEAEARLRHFTPPVESRPRPPVSAAQAIRVLARARGRYLEIPRREGEPGSHTPLFVKGLNLGVALPGRFPTQFPREVALYRAWLEQIAGMNANAVRLYTLLPPEFYQALQEHNREHPEQRLWLLQGAWVELPPGDDFATEEFRGAFRREIERVIDAYHGNLDLPARPGHASGRYRADVSEHVLALILGREWEPFSVVAYNALRPGTHGHDGRYVRLESGSAMEAWLAWVCDTGMAYETERYRVQRPVAFSNWPTLDPLHHPTETSRSEENALRQALGEVVREKDVPQYDDDSVSVDAERFRPGPENHAGLFASYHVYPYHPDFMIIEPGYQTARDSRGVSPYAGYLRALKDHHATQPLLISELGVPTSRGVAHVHPLGWDHGGHSEEDQGRIGARLMQGVHESGCAGGVLFSWLDEWFKHNWLVVDVEIPAERDPLWHNLLDPEESFGLLAARADGGPSLDGVAAEWDELPGALLEPGQPPPNVHGADTAGCAGKIRRVGVASDAAYLHLLLELDGMDCDADGRPDWGRRELLVGIDTHDPDRGEFRLASGDVRELSSGIEFRVRLRGPEASDVQVVPAYDLGSHLPDGPFRAEHSSRGEFIAMTRETNRRRLGRDGTVYPAIQVDHSPLRFKQGAVEPIDDVAVGRDGSLLVVEVRFPWNLLNVTDPSSHRVLFQAGRHEAPFETAFTDGFRFHLSMRDTAGRELDARTVGPYLWEPWEQPDFRLELKRSYGILRDAFADLHASEVGP